jgi:hypothetical protein
VKMQEGRSTSRGGSGYSVVRKGELDEIGPFIFSIPSNRIVRIHKTRALSSTTRGYSSSFHL